MPRNPDPTPAATVASPAKTGLSPCDAENEVRETHIASMWLSINANQLPPSGSSISRPHLQGSAHPVPTTAQQLFAELPAARVRDYLEPECSSGERIITGSGPSYQSVRSKGLRDADASVVPTKARRAGQGLDRRRAGVDGDPVQSVLESGELIS
jgi:hypothetical protein